MTLTLNSTGKAAATRRDALYNASCSCGRWNMKNATAMAARAEHAQHLQFHLGPDAQRARKEGAR